MDNKTNQIATSDSIQFHYLKIIKWLIIGWIVSVIGIVTVFGIMWCQYDYTSETTETQSIIEQNAEDGGNANFIGASGEINNGTSKDNS